MFPDFISDNCNIIHLTTDGTNYLNAAGTDGGFLESTAVDMLGWEGVFFILVTGDNANGAVVTCKAEACSTSGGSYADIAGSSTAYTIAHASTYDYKMVGMDVRRPPARYVKFMTQRTTQNAVLSSLVAIQYGPLKAPITQDTGTAQFFQAPEKHLAPAAGTA